jgi:hypothetical protein
MWLKFAELIERKLLANQPVDNKKLRAYWNRRHVDPMIQMRWEAATISDPNTRTITWPNGRTQHY